MIERQKCPLCGSEPQKIIFDMDAAQDKVAKCLTCGLFYRIFRERPAILDYAHEYYTKWGIAEDNISYLRGKLRDFGRILRELKKFKPQGILLDVGCATGEFMDIAGKNGYEVMGVEPHKEACRIAQDRGLRVVNADFINAPIEADSVDIVSMQHVLEHTLEPDKFLDKAAHVLKKDGILMIEIPVMMKFWFFLLGKKHPVFQGSHVLFFTRKRLISLLEKTGFVVIKSKYSGRTMSLRHLFSRIAGVFGKKIIFPVAGLNNALICLNLGFDFQIIARKA